MYEDEDLQEIHEDIIELNEDISDLRRDLNNISASVEGSGENVILNKTAEARFKTPPLPMGNSEQVQYSGKNLAGPIQGNITSAGITIQATDNSISINGTATDDSTFQLVGETITRPSKYFQGLVLNEQNSIKISAGTYILSSNETGLLKFYGNLGDNLGSCTSITSGTAFTITEDKYVWLGIYIGSGVAINKTIDNLQLEQGSTATSFEPYVGGTASPNPDYPQEITNVGDNINLVDYTTVQPTSNTTVELIENGFKVTGKYAGMITVTGLKENTNYFLQYIRENITGSQTAVNVYAGTTQSTTLRNMLYPNAFNTGNNTTVNIWFYASMGGDIYESNFTFIKLEEGTTMTPYSPYNTGNAQVLVNNKNLFAYNNISLNSYYEINNNTKLLVKRTNYSGAFCQRTPIPVKAGETVHYYFKNNYSSAVRLYVMIADKNMKYIVDYEWGVPIAVNSIVSKSKTLPSNAVYLLFSVLDITDDTDIENSFEIQVEYNNVKTDFIKGNVQSFVFPLAQGQKLMLGDYLADDGIHHVKGQVVLNGTENWNIAQDAGFGTKYTEESGYIAFSKNVPTTLKQPLDDTTKSLCNIGYPKTWFNLQGTVQLGYCILNYIEQGTSNYARLWVTVPRSIANNLNEWVEWLQSNNVVIENALLEEVIVPYTSAQQTVYNQIKQAVSCDEQTNISGFSTNVSPKFEVKAFRNMNASVESLQSRIELLKGRS